MVCKTGAGDISKMNRDDTFFVPQKMSPLTNRESLPGIAGFSSCYNMELFAKLIATNMHSPVLEYIIQFHK